MLHHQSVGWRCTRICQGDTARTVDPKWPKGCSIPHGIVPSIQKWGRRSKWEMFWVTVFVFPSHHYAWWSPGLLGKAEHLPAHGKDWVNSLLHFACVHSFCFTYLTAFIPAMSFLTFTLMILFFILLWEREQAAIWGWAAYDSKPWYATTYMSSWVLCIVLVPLSIAKRSSEKKSREAKQHWSQLQKLSEAFFRMIPITKNNWNY